MYFTDPIRGQTIKPLIIFKKGASKKETEKYDKRVYVMANKKAWMTEDIFYVYMKWLAGRLNKIKGNKILWIDGCQSHFSNVSFTQRLKEEFGIQLEKGIAKMTQFWQPCDQYIISLFKKYIRQEIYQKMKEQENALMEYVGQCNEPPSIEELDELKKEVQMSQGEFRIFITEAVGNAWDKLLKCDDIWVDSWLPSGLTLPVSGNQDSIWKKKMIEKYGGTIVEQPENTDTFTFKMRAITHLYNEIKTKPAITQTIEIEGTQSQSQPKSDEDITDTQTPTPEDLSAFLESSDESEQLQIEDEEHASDEEFMDLSSISNSKTPTENTPLCRGLVNNINKCYQNSILQCWANSNGLINILPSFCELQLNQTHHQSIHEWNDKMEIIRSLYSILTDINDASASSMESVDPKHFIGLLPQPWCSPNQQDCTEFYAYLTGTLDWLLQRSTTQPLLLWDLIQFGLRSKARCNQCGYQSMKLESLCEIQVCFAERSHRKITVIGCVCLDWITERRRSNWVRGSIG